MSRLRRRWTRWLGKGHGGSQPDRRMDVAGYDDGSLGTVSDVRSGYATHAPPRAGTLIEASAEWAPGGESRLKALLAGESADSARSARPRGNPAFSEALFVELMRAAQYARAFAVLAPDCQRSWGSAVAFASAQRLGSLRALKGVNVKEVRYLGEWTDPHRQRTYRPVAELDVEYAFAAGDSPPTLVPRTVHLVPADGKWRSICYPATEAAPVTAVSSAPC